MRTGVGQGSRPLLRPHAIVGRVDVGERLVDDALQPERPFVQLAAGFGMLRAKYNTLWYGVIGHFTYNLGFILLEYAQAVG